MSDKKVAVNFQIIDANIILLCKIEAIYTPGCVRLKQHPDPCTTIAENFGKVLPDLTYPQYSVSPYTDKQYGERPTNDLICRNDVKQWIVRAAYA